MVHRWAAANLRGRTIEIDATERAGRRPPSPVDWLRDGAIDLVAAITGPRRRADGRVPQRRARPAGVLGAAAVPRDHDPPVDALAAALGRYPTSADTAIDPAVAVDGIDELLAGFMTRNKSRLRSESPMVVGVVAEESPTGWLVEVGPAPAVVTVGPERRGRRPATYASRVRPWRST